MRLAIRSLRIWTLIILMSMASALYSAETGSSRPDSLIQMRLTHTVTQGILASAFKENENRFDIHFLGVRAYLQTFMKVWSDLIDSGRFNSSAAIFKHIQQGGGYLARYYPVWQNTTDGRPVRGTAPLLGGYREQLLKQLLASEERDNSLEERLRNLLYYTDVHLVASGGHYDLAELIARPFEEDQNPNVRSAAKTILADIPAQKRAEVMGFMIGALTLGRSSAMSFRLPSYWRTPRPYAAIQGASRYVGGVLKARASRLNLNPILDLLPKHFSSMASAGLHLGGAGLLYWSETRPSNMPQPSDGSAAGALGHPSIMSVGLLWESFNQAFAKNFELADLEDFVPTFKPRSRQDVVASMVAHLKSGAPIDYGDMFLQVEKLLRIDQRDPQDRFVMDFVYNRFQRLQKKAAEIFGHGPISSDQIDAFRKLVIEDVLFNYKRDYPNMTSSFLDWGGNCVAETMVMTSLLEPYQESLSVSDKLAIVLTKNHMEAGLWNTAKRTVKTLIAGTDGKSQGTLYRPQFLMQLALRNFSEAPDDLKYGRRWQYVSKIKKADGTAPSSKLGFNLGFLKKLFEQGDKRFGALETNRMDDLDPSSGEDGDSNRGEEEDIPYSATITFSEMSKAQDFSGSFSGEAFGSEMGERGEGGTRREKGEGQSKGGSALAQFLGRLSSEKSKKPLSVSINLQKKPYLFNSFSWDGQTKRLIAYDEATYLKFLQVRNQAKMVDHKFASYVKTELARNLDKMAYLEFLNRVFPVELRPIRGQLLLEYKKISDEDLRQLGVFLEELKDLQASLDLGYLSRRTMREFFSAFVTSPHDLKTRSEGHLGLEALKTFANSEKELLNAIIQNPRLFLEVYDQASLALRENLLARSFGPEMFDYVLKNHVLENMAKDAVRNYLNSLSEIKIDFSRENNWICSQVKIDLPKVKAWPEEWTEYPDRDCGNQPLIDADAKSKKPNEEIQQAADRLTLKVSTLIELTVSFGAGLHLWNDEAVDAFVDGRYSKILPDRLISVTIVKALVKGNPTLARIPRYQRLL